MAQAPSVVIPALNEAHVLPRLVDALHAQTMAPAQVIVADAGSVDDTVGVALAAGCSVVRGGMPAVGRNAGAAIATSDVILFLDADVVPEPDFIAKAMDEFERTGCTVATCVIEPLEPGAWGHFITWCVCTYMKIVRPFSPHAPGACIAVRREAHVASGGFDELAVLTEDHDYVHRVAKLGRFRVLKSVKLPVSMRRLHNEPFFPLLAKTLWCEYRVFAGKPIHSIPFEYAFGSHDVDLDAEEGHHDSRRPWLRKLGRAFPTFQWLIYQIWYS